MHEVSIICSAMDEIESQCIINNINKVSRILLAIGKFAAVDYGALKFAFEGIAKDTICDGAVLEVMEIQPRAYCASCNKEYELYFTQKNCPICGKIGNIILRGDDILLYKIEGE